MAHIPDSIKINTERNAKAIELLVALVSGNDDPCNYTGGSDPWCQDHYGEYNGRCAVGEARKFLEELSVEFD
jgi:hypothetical protein